jgi:transposase
MEALYLKSQGFAHQEIARLCHISESTLGRCLKEYASGGLEKLAEMPFHRPQRELAKYRQQLASYFREHPPATVTDATPRRAGTSLRSIVYCLRLFISPQGVPHSGDFSTTL